MSKMTVDAVNAISATVMASVSVTLKRMPVAHAMTTPPMTAKRIVPVPGAVPPPATYAVSAMRTPPMIIPPAFKIAPASGAVMRA